MRIAIKVITTRSALATVKTRSAINATATRREANEVAMESAIATIKTGSIDDALSPRGAPLLPLLWGALLVLLSLGAPTQKVPLGKNNKNKENFLLQLK